MKIIRGLLSAAALLAIIAIFSASAWGQTNASMRGTVTDQSGAVVAGAKVTLTNTGTGIARSTTTGSDGLYLFDLVHVGKYKINVEKDGFTTYLQEGIVLELNQNGRVDVALKIGKTSQTVEVTANVAQVDTTGAVLGKVETQRMIVDLPLVDRDTLQLGLLQAGVFSPDQDDSSGNPFSVSGQRSESLTFLLDGGNNTDFLGNNIVVSPNPDAVEEFKILTNNYDAQYGRTSGGIVNQVTKSGTNDFHGDAFEFIRNDVLNAKDYFLPEGVAKASFKRNVFGGTGGGPIIKDKTFFFVAYQGARRREGETTGQQTVLSPAERTGNFGELCPSYDGAGNCADTVNGTQLVNPFTDANVPFNDLSAPGQGGPGAGGSLVNPVIQNYITKYLPLPNLPNNGFISSPSKATDEDQGIVHIDHNLTGRDTLSFVYLIDDLRIADPLAGGTVPLGSGGDTTVRSQISTFTWNHAFADGRVNEFRFATNRVATDQSIPTDTTSPAALGFTNLNPDDPAGTAPPAIFTTNFNLGPSVQGPTTLHDATFQWSDNFTLPHGRHEFKFGVDITRIRQNYNYDYYNNGGFDFGENGTYTGDPLADFVGGFYDNYYQNSKSVYGLRTGSFGGYFQDTWKVTSRLTLDIGGRYDYYVPISDVHNEILGFFPGQQSTVFPGAPPGIVYPGDPGTPNRALVYPDYKNFAPRFGFAWDMLGNAKLVMRGGFGIFYDIEDGALNLQFGGLPPFGGVTNIFPSAYDGSGNYVGGDPVADPFGSFGQTNVFPFTFTGTFGVPSVPYAYVTNPHFRTPYSQNFNYGFQWQATKDTLVEAVYVGSLGRKLISTAEVNYPVPTVLMEQQSLFGSTNPDCARPLAACVGGSSPIDPAGSPTGALQLYTNLSNGISNSNQFQLTVDKRFSGQFALRAAYTVAKTIDLTSGFRSRSSTYTDPVDYGFDRGLADFDVPQRLVISGIWSLPIDRPFKNNAVMEKVIGGWQFNAIVTYQKGQPFTIYSNLNSSQQNNFLDRPDLIGPIKYIKPRTLSTFDTAAANCIGDTGTVTGNFFFNPTAYDCANVPEFSFGDLGRNTLRGPGIDNYDLSFIKRASFTESKSMEFRAEFFNAFNHGQFYNPDRNGYDATFGQITSARPPRLIQFGLKLYY
ncbi:MAG TPA: carboxypeptidase regulatory-like domain-containing protein [Candidatus Acidoferrales bacterium]